MRKAQIRKQALQERLNLSDEVYNILNAQLFAQFKKLDLSLVKTLHTFLPIPGKREPDTFPLIKWLQETHPEIKIIVPKADFETALMTHHEYLGEHDLKKNLYDILEPQKGMLHEGEIDLVLVPLLAFDLRGYRVGYGKGFYDRFLKPVNARKIGLSLSNAGAIIEDADKNDIRLDQCITPTAILSF